MLKQVWKFVRNLIILLVAVGLLALMLPRLVTMIYSWTRLYTVESAPADRVAIVFGAGLTRDGQPTLILKDRVRTAVQLYRNGKVEKILMSGDNQGISRDEPGAMRDYAVSLGVPAQDIVLDNSGDRTYDTCYRAKAIFGLDSALLVTQQFHLPRALFLCNMLGIQAVGVDANNYHYWPPLVLIWNIREQLATVGAFWDVYVEKPLPVLGKPQPIFMEN
ncbi:MAG TPA: ElyC/SanA/YdcF family protein [Anaerolineales bacterium]|nr:ElyC/SanA/YdcF family protein [Anaerolineales bacterium]